MSRAHPLRAALAVAALACIPASGARAEADAESLVNALNAVFGKHDGLRAAHTNGICVKGTFKPAADASKLSKAAHFAGTKEFPIVGRFSMGGGDPKASNAAKDNARGFAMHIDVGNGNVTDMVLLSAPIFAAKNPDQFLKLLTTVATGDKAKIDAYFKENPESTEQGKWLSARPVPASYATANYYSVHAFTLTNAEGKKTIVKYLVKPKGGEVGLSDDEAKAKAPDFYAPELTERLAKGPAEFEFDAVIGETGDVVDNPTVDWPEGRKSTPLGVITISGLEDNKTCDAGMFSPAALIEGIDGPENDSIYQMRTPAYAVSFGRRAQ